MTTAQLIFSIYIYSMLAVYMASFWKLFQQRGRKAWEGLIPGYNIFVWLKVMQKPWWWIFFFMPYIAFDPFHFSFLLEGVVFLMLLIMNVELGRAFGKHTPKDVLTFLFVPQYAIIRLTYLDKPAYEGPTDWSDDVQREKRRLGDHVALFFSTFGLGHIIVFIFMLIGSKDKKDKKTIVKEWSDAFLFALVAATIIRTLIIEAFNIPSPSMEKELLVGDYLFVSKVSYGPKLPNTPLAIPFVHNTIPLINTKSYVEWQKRPYRRLPGLGSVDRNDIVVFNFPAGDTAINDPGADGLMGHDYYQQLRRVALQFWMQQHSMNANIQLSQEQYMQFLAEFPKYKAMARKAFEDKFGLIGRPVDKRENYIKRCVAIAGDSLEIRDRIIYINGQPAETPENLQFRYKLWLKGDQPLNDNVLKEEYDINLPKPGENRYPTDIRSNKMFADLSLTAENLELFSNTPEIDSITPQLKDRGYNYAINSLNPMPIFPNHPSYDWTEDNFGPLYIPEEGVTIDLTEEKNRILYRRIISVYEGHDMEVKDDGVYIDGSKTDTYTFEMNYYWMMGDNRHESADSRFWGFVPEDHVVGKAVFIWFSKDPEGGIRWNRIFRTI